MVNTAIPLEYKVQGSDAVKVTYTPTSFQPFQNLLYIAKNAASVWTIYQPVGATTAGKWLRFGYNLGSVPAKYAFGSDANDKSPTVLTTPGGYYAAPPKDVGTNVISVDTVTFSTDAGVTLATTTATSLSQNWADKSQASVLVGIQADTTYPLTIVVDRPFFSGASRNSVVGFAMVMAIIINVLCVSWL